VIPLERLVREPSDLAVAASFRRLNEAIHSHDQARIDLVLAEISGLAAREARAEGSARETPGPRLHQPSLVEGRRR